MIAAILILSVLILALLGLCFLLIKRIKAEKAKTEKAEKEVKKLKGNIVQISQSLARDKKIIKGGQIIGKAIKTAKTDNDAHNILLDISADLDGLL